MSIINDAIKKARKEFESRRSGAARATIRQSQDQPPSPPDTSGKSSDIKWTAMVTLSLVIIVSLLGSIALYRHLSLVKIDYSAEVNTPEPDLLPPVPVIDAPAQKGMPVSYRANAKIELNGIVYGPDDKWAIINNRIVREGDALPGGELTHISGDFVKIRKQSGEEITLDLR